MHLHPPYKSSKIAAWLNAKNPRKACLRNLYVFDWHCGWFLGNKKRPVLTGLSYYSRLSSADAVRKRIEKPIQFRWEIVACVRKSKYL